MSGGAVESRKKMLTAEPKQIDINYGGPAN